MRWALVCIVLWLLAHATQATAQACNTFLSESTCYIQRASCRWDPLSALCQTGAPATCEQRYRDTVNCTGICAINAFNNQCYQRPQVPPASAICNNQTTVQGCIGAGCFYDVYFPSNTSTGGKCVANLAEVKALFPSCVTYHNYPTNVFPNVCTDQRVCIPLAGTQLCQNPAGVPGQDAAPANNVVTQFFMSLLNPSLHLPSLNFSITAATPIDQFLNLTEPMLHTFGFGNIDNLPRPLQPFKCHDVLMTRPIPNSGFPRIDPPFADGNALKAGLLASTDLVYNSGDAIATALYQATGYTKVGGTSTTQSVSITNTTVFRRLHANSDWLVSNCNSTRTVVSVDEYRYRHKICLDAQTRNFQATQCIFVYNSVYTYGEAFFGATQRGVQRIFVSVPVDTTDGALVPGTLKRRWYVDHTLRTNNPNVVLGLRDLRDVSMLPVGGTVQTTPPTNCYGTRPVQVIPPTGMPSVCTDIAATTPPTYCWVSRIFFETRYVVPAMDGSTFALCSNQLPADRIADMGADIPYPTYLNARQDYYQFAKQWPVGNLTTGPFFSITTDATGSMGDFIGVSLPQNSPIDIDFFGGILAKPVFGILPTPSSPITSLIVPTYANPSNSSFVVDLRNAALSTNSLLIFAGRYGNNTRKTYRLNFRRSLYFIPVDATGEIIRASSGAPIATVPYTDIALTTPYTIRSDVGAKVDAVNAELGVDAVSVVVSDMQNRMRANGFGVVLPYYGSLPVIADSPQSNGRRLLQADEEDGATVIDQAQAMFVVLLPLNLTQSYYYPDSEYASAKRSLALMGTLTGIFLVTIGVSVVFGVTSVKSGAVTASTSTLLTSSPAANTRGRLRAERARSTSRNRSPSIRKTKSSSRRNSLDVDRLYSVALDR